MHAFTAYCVRSQQNTLKTDTKRISQLPHDNTKITKHRSVVVCDTARCSKFVWTDGSGAFGDPPRDPIDDSLALLACLGRPKIAPGTILGRPGPITSACWSVFKTALSIQNCARSNFCPFLVYFGRSLVRFHIASFVCSVVFFSSHLHLLARPFSCAIPPSNAHFRCVHTNLT